ncbi:hypothetical protein Acsp02_37270 [Actinoplanes sp. NBRC 103695]|nr:hypothetical protein Acsp02_37270 [Actinoplanes sp. NBRC 103695]
MTALGRGATVRLVAPLAAAARFAAAGRACRAARGCALLAIVLDVVSRTRTRCVGREARPGLRAGPWPLGVRRCVIPALPRTQLVMELRHLLRRTYARRADATTP